MNFINENVQGIEITGIRKFFNKVAEVEDAISMTIGQPDFPVPHKIKLGMINALENNKTGYTKNEGNETLREEISKYLLTQDIKFGKDEICVTAGGSEGIFSSIAAVCNDGDKFLVPDPAYPAYEGCIRMLGGTPVKYKLDDKFQPDFEYIEKLMKKEKIKGIVVSYPCNPTGAILEKESFKSLVEIISRGDIVAITDEMYSSIKYSHKEYLSLAQVEPIKEKVIVIGGFSKIFSMTGLRVGYICAHKSLLDKIKVVHQHNTTCANSIAQIGAEIGLRECMHEVEERNKKFKERRDYVCSRLNSMGIKSDVPKGAFYIFGNIKRLGMTSEEFCERLLKEAKVAVVPGSAFGENGEGYIRISYCYSMKNLKDALDRIEKWIGELC